MSPLESRAPQDDLSLYILRIARLARIFSIRKRVLPLVQCFGQWVNTWAGPVAASRQYRCGSDNTMDAKMEIGGE